MTDRENKHMDEKETKDISSIFGKVSTKSESKDEDDPADVIKFPGLDPRDETAKVEKRGTIYEAVTNWEELKLTKELYNGVVAMKFVKPSKIQAEALPIILSPERTNLIAQAHHGSGKTATYSLGMLSRIQPDKRVVQAICLCPSRELARQVAEVIQALGRFTKATVCLAIPESAREAVTDPIVVGTPGTVLAKIRHREIDARQVTIFVCDEADVMVLTGSEGMGDQTIDILKKIPKPQVLLFSATFPEKVRKFALAMAPSASKIVVKREELTLEGIKQFYMEFKHWSEKFEALTNLYGVLNIGQSIVFVHTRQTAKELCRKMREKDYAVSLLHGADMSADERDKVMADFKTAKTTVLISTNVLARGIDVLQVTLVVNYDIPLTADNKADPTTYIHRIGRSGRFGRKGVAINFVHDRASKANLGEIADFYGATISQLPTNDYGRVETLIKSALGKS